MIKLCRSGGFLGDKSVSDQSMNSVPPAQDGAERQIKRLRSVAGRWLFRGTLAVAIFEWLMFELLRMPYRPPADMRTMLGMEKYDLFGFMCFIAAVWLLCTIAVLVLERLTKLNFVAFVALLVAIAATYAIIIVNPPWSVTPWNHILS